MGTEGAAHRLETLSGFPKSYITLLKPHWIETAEQFLSVCSTQEGTQGVRRLLEIDQRRLEDIIKQLRDVVGQEPADRLSRPVPTRPLGLTFGKKGEEKP